MIISCIYTYTYNNEMLSNHWLHLMSLFSYLYFLSKNFKKNKLKKKNQKTNHLYSVMMTKNLADFVI